MTGMKEQGKWVHTKGRRKGVRQMKCKRVSGDRTTCSKTIEIRGRRVRDTSGEPVVANVDEEQQLIEGRSYADAVAKGTERRLRVIMRDSIVRKLNKIINKGGDVTVCLPGANIEDVTKRVGQVMGNGHGDPFLCMWAQIMLRRKVRQPPLRSTEN